MSLLDALFLDPSALNVWVAARTDGVLGSGTLADPYNGSTVDSFDRVMNLIAQFPQSRHVHLGPGVFETRGYSDQASDAGWQPAAGMRITGSGMDVTTLRLVGAAQTDGQYFAIGHALGASGRTVDFFEVADLTIDCNLAGQPADVASGAVRAKGTHSSIRRVKAINWGTRTTAMECYVISSIVADAELPTAEIFDSVIDRCVAVQPSTATLSNGVVTVLHWGNSGDVDEYPAPTGESAVIQNCYVDGSINGAAPLGHDIRALSVCWCHAAIVEGNQIHNVRHGGPCQLQYSVPELIVRNNLYRNVVTGLNPSMGTLHPTAALGFTGITKQTSAKFPQTARVAVGAAHGFHSGVRVKIAGTSSSYDGFAHVRAIPLDETTHQPDLTKFDIYSLLGDASSGTVQEVIGIRKLLVEGNTFELAPPADDLTPVGVFVGRPDMAWDSTHTSMCSFARTASGI
jgi:hypothetical protein